MCHDYNIFLYRILPYRIVSGATIRGGAFGDEAATTTKRDKKLYPRLEGNSMLFGFKADHVHV